MGKILGNFWILVNELELHDFFFHKNVSHLLGETVQFFNVQTDYSVLHVLDCVTNQTGTFRLVGCFFPTAMCVSAGCMGLANTTIIS